jgi:hypothetical protein
MGRERMEYTGKKGRRLRREGEWKGQGGREGEGREGEGREREVGRRKVSLRKYCFMLLAEIDAADHCFKLTNFNYFQLKYLCFINTTPKQN